MMDAVKFINEYSRLCKTYGNCEVCPFQEETISCSLTHEKAEKLVTVVEQWSQSHPQKTMMQDFFEKFPNATKDSSGNPMVCPQALGYGDFCCDDTNHNCTMCWSRPLEK